MQNADQHPVFVKYRREWLREMTGYSKCYLSRVAIGRLPLSRAFIERVCYRLQKPESELFLLDPKTPSEVGARH